MAPEKRISSEQQQLCGGIVRPAIESATLSQTANGLQPALSGRAALNLKSLCWEPGPGKVDLIKWPAGARFRSALG